MEDYLVDTPYNTFRMYMMRFVSSGTRINSAACVRRRLMKVDSTVDKSPVIILAAGPSPRIGFWSKRRRQPQQRRGWSIDGLENASNGHVLAPIKPVHGRRR